MKAKTVRLAVFVFGCGIMGFACFRAGVDTRSAVVLTLLTGLLSWLTVYLPWGGRLYPSDAILLFYIFTKPLPLSMLFSLGTATAQAVGAKRLREALASMIRTICVVGVSGFFLSYATRAGQVVVQGQSQRLTIRLWNSPDLGSTQRLSLILLLATSLYFIVASGMDSLLRSKRRFSFGEYWLLNFGANVHHHLFTLLLGAMMVICYPYLDLLSLVLLSVPVLLTRDVLKRSLDLRASRIEAIKALSSSVDARDKYTYDHSNRVARLAGMLSREMGFAEWMVEVIEGGALLHDIGKLSIDAEILTKPGSLDEWEWELIKQHPIKSAQVVSQVELLKHSAEIVRHHHERPDGKGYPEGLKGHQIPIGARILNVADAFDAIISDRPYRKGKPPEVALDELRKGAGTEFDPVVVEYLTRLARNGQLEYFQAKAG